MWVEEAEETSQEPDDFFFLRNHVIKREFSIFYQIILSHLMYLHNKLNNFMQVILLEPAKQLGGFASHPGRLSPSSVRA